MSRRGEPLYKSRSLFSEHQWNSVLSMFFEFECGILGGRDVCGVHGPLQWIELHPGLSNVQQFGVRRCGDVR